MSSKQTAKREPKPRVGHYFGMKIANVIGENGTWLEGEEFTYPSGAMKRRCRALCSDGTLRVVLCGIPDTYFSIPAKGGYITSADGVFTFHAEVSTNA